MTTLPHCATDTPFPTERPLPTQALPFTVRLASKTHDLPGLVALRALAYGRHLPGMDEVLKAPEPDDLREDVVLLVAQSKADGRLLGSLRLISNQCRPVSLEGALPADSPLRGRKLGEVGRLTVLPGAHGRLVSSALYKAAFEASAKAGIEHVLLTARAPVDRLYRGMQLKDVLGGRRIPVGNTLGVPHTLYELPIKEAVTRWRQAQTPFYGFVALTHHPDILVDQTQVNRLLNGGARASETPHTASPTVMPLAMSHQLGLH